MRLLLHYPTRSRALLFQKTLDLYYSMLSNRERWQWIITMDLDDPTMNNDPIRKYLDSKPNLKYFYGNSKTKVEAVNADIPDDGSWDILLTVSDDMLPRKKGFNNIICDDMLKYFPEADGALFYPDGGLGGNKCWTLSIIGKNYYDLDSYVYNPSFESLWCDNAAQDVAMARKKLKYIPNCIIQHAWITYTGKDDLHERNSGGGQYQKDELIYKKFKAEGFPELKSKLPNTKVVGLLE
jgi:hypothetical protein